MLNWIRKLFTGLDRTEAASDRAALALEGIADLLEQAHVALRQRLVGSSEPEPAEPLPAPAKNGKKKLTHV
jgi:hypothetical protein